MYGPFTEDARQVVVRAHAEAHRLGHSFLGGEHLLYGLAGDQGPVGELLRRHGVDAGRVEAEFVRLVGGDRLDAAALSTLGIDLDAVRTRVEAAFGPGALSAPAVPPTRRGRRPFRRRPSNRRRSGHLPLTRRAIGSLERSLLEARALHHEHLGVEHLALSLLADRGGLPPRILSGLGVSATELRTEIHRTIT